MSAQQAQSPLDDDRLRTASIYSESVQSVNVISIGSKLRDHKSIQNNKSINIKQNAKLTLIVSSSSIFIFTTAFTLYFIHIINAIILLFVIILIIAILFGLIVHFNKRLHKYETHIESLGNRILELQHYINTSNSPQHTSNIPHKTSMSHQRSLSPIAKINTVNPDLLQGFRNGQLSEYLKYCSAHDLVSMLPLVTMCITLLPFGMRKEKEILLDIMKNRAEMNRFIAQQIHYFLFSYFDDIEIRRLFQKDKIMKYVMQSINYYEKIQNTPTHWESITENPLMYDQRSGMSLSPIVQQTYTDRAQRTHKFPKFVKNMDMIDANAVYIDYNDSDPIRLYRMAIDSNLKEGAYINITGKYHHHFYDPLYGIGNVEQLLIKKQYPSAAKPYLIECFAKTQSTNHLSLCSSFILKKGDIRKDGAVIQMFRFMNLLWKDNMCCANVLCYKCVPFGDDIGVIEFIPNCVDLAHINDIEICNIDNLLAKSAGSYIAAFVLGIRDRHDENILIRTTDCTLFHIDFGFLFGDKAGNNMVYGADTAKLAITSSLQKLMDKYKENGWSLFVDLSCDAYCILRNNYKEILDLTRVLFGGFSNSKKSADEIDAFLRDTLKMNKSETEARDYIYNKLINAPKKLKTKIKNKVHNIVQQIKA